MSNRILVMMAAVALPCVLVPARAVADTLELKNGTIASGSYAGGTATTLRFETAQGVQVIPTGDILAITFSGGAGAASAAAAPAAATATPGAAPDAAPASVTIPAGTPLVVRMMD